MARATRAMGSAFAPVRRHPQFRAIVACWCAALFGLSALAIRPEQLEAFAFSVGIDRLIPLPLGMAARMLTALGFAFAGGLIGFALARAVRITGSGKVERQDSRRPSCTDRAPMAASESSAKLATATAPSLGKAAERLLAAELTTLSPIELVERLGIAMQCPGSRMCEAVLPAASVRRASVPAKPSQLPARIDGEQALRFALANLQRFSGTA